METLDHIDRERRRTKPKKRRNWAKALMRPQTVTFMVAMGRLITQVVRLVITVIMFFRD